MTSITAGRVAAYLEEYNALVSKVSPGLRPGSVIRWPDKKAPPGLRIEKVYPYQSADKGILYWQIRSEHFVNTAGSPSCGKGDTAVSWAQVGPMGPAGPQGPQGPQGLKVRQGRRGPLEQTVLAVTRCKPIPRL